MPDRCQTRTDAVPAPVPEPVPWKRQPGESSKAYYAFCHYVEAGPNRSLRKLAKFLGRGEGASWLKDWSRRYGWVARAAAWDDEQRKAALEQQETGQALRKVANYLRNKGINGLVERQDELTPAQLLKLFGVAEKLEQGAARF